LLCDVVGRRAAEGLVERCEVHLWVHGDKHRWPGSESGEVQVRNLWLLSTVTVHQFYCQHAVFPRDVRTGA